MILSHRWLGRHLSTLPDSDTVQRGLEQLGIEVAQRTLYGQNFGMVELVEVVSRSPHPQSDHLALVEVSRGSGEITQIVTGAANGFPKDRLWYAPPGTTLPDGRTLGVRDLRGIASPGMLLSCDELGYQWLGGDLWVWDGPEPLGTTFLQGIGGTDTLYDLELTPNIAQYLQSVRHIAMELGAILGIEPIDPPSPFPYRSDPIAEIEDFSRCPLYGLVAMTLKPGQVSPLWMQSLLRAVGHRIIHPAVDVTNFVLWDLGEPLHAFDARRVRGRIRVRQAYPGETLSLLDGQLLTLSVDDLVIADADKVLALAGVMGGVDSGIAPDTKEVLLECAHFSAPGIFASSKRHGLATDAALHFGRGTDPEAVYQSPSLVIGVLGVAGILDKVGPSALLGGMPEVRRIAFEPERIRQILGVLWSDEKIQDALQHLGYVVDHQTVRVPLYRHDVALIQDLAEDVLRFYGLENVPLTTPKGETHLAQRDSKMAVGEHVRDVVAAFGYEEVFTSTFSRAASQADYLTGAQASAVGVTNPLRDDASSLRQTILPSLLDVVRYNRARHDRPIKIFEVGSVFEKEGDAVQEYRELGVVLSLDAAVGWPSRVDPCIYDLTGLVDGLSRRLGWPLVRSPFADMPAFLHPGRAQQIRADGRSLGYVGELRPSLASKHRVRQLGVLVLRVPEVLARLASWPGRPSRFPEVQRDLSLVVPENISYAKIVDTINQLQVSDLQSLSALDRFRGDFGVSLTVRLTFQSPDETLKDADVDQFISNIIKALGAIGVEPRQ